MALNCPGYNRNVIGLKRGPVVRGSGATAAAALADAEGQAVAAALGDYYRAIATNQCPGRCLTTPFFRVVRVRSAGIQGPTEIFVAYLAEARAEWELDVLCTSVGRAAAVGGGGGGGDGGKSRQRRR